MFGSKGLRLGAVGVAITLLSACGADTQGSTGDENSQEVKLGALVTTSGVNGFVGVSASKAFEVAVKTINADPTKYLGSADRTLKIDNKDAGETASNAVALMRSMAADKSYLAFVGPSTSPQALALGPLAQASKAPLVVPHSPAPKITDPGDYVFQTAATNDLLGKQVIEAVVPKSGLKKVGVIYSPDNNANLLAGQTVKATLASLGVEAVEFTLPSTDTDYTAAISKMRDAKVDGVFIATNAGGVASAIIQGQRTGFKPQWMGNPMFANKAVFGNAGQASVGSILATDYNPNLKTPLNEKFRADYQAAAGTAADAFAAQAFSSVLTIAAAVKAIPASQEVTRDNLKDSLSKVKDVEVVIGDGKLSISPKRTSLLNAALLEIDASGGFKPVS